MSKKLRKSIMKAFKLIKPPFEKAKQKNILNQKACGIGEKPEYKFDTVKYKNGDVYEGELRRRLRHGHGLYIFRSGDRYEGSYFSSMKDGYGVYNFSNGDTYEGFFKKNRKHGLGRYTKKSNGKVLQGKWERDKLKINLNDSQYDHARDKLAEKEEMEEEMAIGDVFLEDEIDNEFETQLYVENDYFDERSMLVQF